MKKLFLLWSLIAALTAVASFIAFKIGGFGFAYKYDTSKITFLIFAILYFVTAWAGWLSWKASKVIDDYVPIYLRPTVPKEIRNIKNDANHIDTASELCTLFGLLGTIVGIIMAFFGNGEFKGVHNNPNLGAAVGTAFITTGAGIVSCVILVLQHRILIHALNRKEISLTPEVEKSE